MNSVKDLLNSITPEIYENIKTSVEIGKWPNGERLTTEQKELCMQAIIAYENTHLPPEQHTGFIPPQKHTHCGSNVGSIANDDVQPITIRDKH